MTQSAIAKQPQLTFSGHWPAIETSIPLDADREAFIATIVEAMSIEEKIGQMIQPDLREVTPDEVTQYKLGSILNGGGAFPNHDKYASAQDWVDTADI